MAVLPERGWVLSREGEIKLAQARAALPLKQLMEQHGKGPENGNWKAFPKCPYCGKKGAGVFNAKDRGVELFKCHHTSCPSGAKALDEIGFLALEMNCSRTDAWQAYLKAAGVWKDHESHAPSVMPGKAARRVKVPGLPDSDEPDEPAAEETISEEEPVEFETLATELPPLDEDEELIQQCIEVIRAEQKASVSLLQRRLRLGYTRAARIMDELEARGMVGPAKGQEPRDILIDLDLPQAKTPPRRVSAEGESAAGSPFTNEKESRPAVDAVAVPPIQPVAADGTTAPADAPPHPDSGDVSISGASAPVSGAAAALVTDQKTAPQPDQSPENPDPQSHNSTDGGEPPGAVIQLPPGPPPQSPQAALQWFYDQLELSDVDRATLWRERGLTAETCEALGYRSNPQVNKEILMAMAQMWPPEVLLECGLWTQGDKPADPPKPNAQFYGMAIVPVLNELGRKVKSDGETVTKCVWNNPILIPYFDEAGELVHLRPHKGMMRGKAPRFYACRPGKAALALFPPAHYPQFGLMTEGEFKAGALWQLFRKDAVTGALPGITMAKPLFADIEEWVSESEARQVIVGYDNEEKGDPKLKHAYQEDKWRRYDAQIWARYLARQLGKEGYEAKVCVLPNEWRDAKGKADWDGQLARRIKELLKHPTTPPALHSGAASHETELSNVQWLAVREQIRGEFLRVISGAAKVNELWQADFFDREEERIIKNGLENICYEPKLPIGGDDELVVVRKLHRFAAKMKGADAVISTKNRGFLLLLAKKYQELAGGYYTFKALSDKMLAKWVEVGEKAFDEDNVELKRIVEIVMKGIPNRVSDFYLKAHYVLSKMNSTRTRLVTIRNIHGVTTGLLQLQSGPFAQPSKFREWLLDNSTGATWSAGERELNALQEDTAREVAHKDVAEVVIRGYHADSKCWFFNDVTFTDAGEMLFADKFGCIWVRSKSKKVKDGDEEQKELVRAYKLSETDHEGQSFRHGSPKMKPAVVVKDGEIKELFQLLAEAMFSTIGGNGGFLALGTVLSFGAGPEIYGEHNGFPSLWVHGEPRQGKTTIARLLMRLWGVMVDKGIPLKDSTKVGLSITLQQYGNIPVWFEEFQPSAPDWMVEKLKNIYGRESGSKKTFDEGDRQILTGVIVTGVATSTDPQLRSRFAHVQVAANKRLANCLNWFQAESPRFFLLGRYILQHRKEFSEKVLAGMREWIGHPLMEGMDDRARIVHGAAYASFVALGEMLGVCNEPALLENFRKFLAVECREAVQDVDDQVNVNQFWRDLIDALDSEAFGETPMDRKGIFKVMPHTPKKSQLTERQYKAAGEDASKAFPDLLLYFKPGPVIDMLRKYKRMGGKELPLDKADLRKQMQTRPYWVPASSEAGHRQRFTGKSSESCWCIDLSRHELGYRAVTDDEFEASLMKPADGGGQGTFLTREEWVDPRKGDLFALVESLKGKESSEDKK